ncbi:peptidoglycan editing factor PgeF [Polycladidibacter stylochi]|uniref:peptidoglycan editing factor PgeF n=1 Tax=Polycladidibacter stylochi TaxID=1807766 RepID=UPI0009EB2C2F|nr:peptidoglycan editing factor PgeF [Pseudovibrio stylochi]
MSLPVICEEKFSRSPQIRHGFFTRQGGVSTGIYESLNVGRGSHDNSENVEANRARIATYLGVSANHLLTSYQVHSSDVAIVSTPFTNEPPKLDALATNTPGIALGVLTADCGPVLFADPKAGVIAAAHAGWKGALGGILQATIEKMQQLGAHRHNIIATLGPTISGRNYEVGPEFQQKFVAASSHNKRFFNQSNNAGHFMFDLPAYIIEQLEATDIASATNINRCTYEEEQQFFSYRRSTHQKQPDYGRQISAIALQP